MDFGTLMMSQGIPTGILPAMNNENALMPEGANGAEFVNLLDLVEGLETAELSSASDSELNFAQAAEGMSDELSEKVDSDKNAALAGLALSSVDMNAGLINKSVGQEPLVKNESLGMDKVTKEIASPGNVFLNAPAPTVSAPEAKLSSESVAAWTTAFAANEVTNVDVSKAVPEGSDLSLNRQVASNSRDMMLSEEGAPAPALASASLVEEKLAAKPEASTAAQHTKPALADKGQEGFAPMAATVERVSAREVPRALASQDVSGVSDKTFSKESKKNESVQAKDFFLDRAEISSGSSGVQAKTVLAAAVASKGMSSQIGDQNVVDFVSDKVLNLQNAGGGTLRVGLDTKDMGQIEIKVSLRGGRVDVQVSGESPELARQLEANRSELTAKLEKHVELGDLSIGKTQVSRFEDSKQLLSNAGNYRITEDLVRNVVRDGVDASSRIDQPRSERLDSLRSAAPLGRSDESAASNQGFGRDERRGQAMAQWANSSQMRQSA